jgi:hypothetical protein
MRSPSLSPAPPRQPALTGDPPAGQVRFDRLPLSVVVERRLTNRALAAWQRAPADRMAAALSPFFDHSIVVRDPAGRPALESVGGPVSARFGLIAGLPLDRDPGLGEELVAACELVALQPMPIPFECSVTDPLGAQLMVRGLALPLPEGDDPAALVQIVLSWREVLSRSAARRLQAELARAFAEITPLPPGNSGVVEPFPRRPVDTQPAAARPDLAGIVGNITENSG